MSISTKQHMVATSHGCLAVEESGQDGMRVLLIHGKRFGKVLRRLGVGTNISDAISSFTQDLVCVTRPWTQTSL